ncbi:unnamed protein product [Acanthoscelides obtectus]|uniref:HTH psq-type domain-containing protein n=1 Tax=Acanthoscelides obtectus TaxID=200917 RepID=A0A9P0PUZ0_ACAOB|nr:unnamed protein product [Acanthoscelides obtectus]CAK1627142.1 hypothetical protein AOBTE_LOCUS4337 [Acanthoscelides obtectus]
MPKTTVVDKKRKKWNEENMRKAVIAARCKQMGYLKARKTYNVPGATLFRLCKKNMEPEVVCRTKLGRKRLAYCERSGLIIALNGLLRTLGHLLEGRAKGRDVAQHHQGSTCQVVYYTELVFGLVADQVSELVFQDSFDMRNHFRLVDKKSGVEIVYQVVCKDL